jgi:hypothetical protein
MKQRGIGNLWTMSKYNGVAWTGKKFGKLNKIT